MIVLLCLLIVLGSSHCDELPSRFEIENSINRTINEVERLIRQDSTLPRLTRREIVDILFNITSKDLETYRNKETIEKARKIYQRALMVVLPYNAENSKENIKDLYTKPPIVQIIADPSNPNLEAWKSEILRSSTQDTPPDAEASENLVVTHASEKASPKESLYAKTQYKNHRETYSDVQANVPLKETLKFDSAPIKFSFNLESLQQQPSVTEEPISTRRPVFQRPSSNKDEEVYIVYSTSATTARAVETSPEDFSRFDTKESQTSSPFKLDQNVLSSNQWRYNAPPSTTSQRAITSSRSSVPLPEAIRDKQPFVMTVKPEDATRSTATSVTKKIEDIPKVTFEKTRTESVQRPSIYVTPVSSSSLTSEKSKYNSTYNLNSGGFHRITTTTTTTMRPQVMELLASIGLRPQNATKVEEVFKESKESLENKSQIPGSNGLLYAISGLTGVSPDSPSIVAQNTFENPVSELGKGMNNLTPDVQLLFQRFGLQTSNLGTTSVASTPKPTVNTNSYTNFKPLPTSKVKDQDMKEFLAKFGLGVNERQRKAMPEPTERPSLIEAVPNNMRQILENIGLISRKTPIKMTTEMEGIKPTAATKFHIFKPHEVRLQNEEQRIKINELLDTVRLVQEGKANVKDVRRVADDLLATRKSLKDGPDPLSLEEIINVYNEDLKNEVKRQQSPMEPIETSTDGNQDLANTSTTPAAPSLSTESVDASTMIATTTVTSTTSDSAKSSSDLLDISTLSSDSSSSTTITSLVALEESFGGTTSAPDPDLPPKRKNGLYFLVDWNSFLEVGENTEKVNLRFQPRAGDRTRFLPVTIP